MASSTRLVNWRMNWTLDSATFLLCSTSSWVPRLSKLDLISSSPVVKWSGMILWVSGGFHCCSCTFQKSRYSRRNEEHTWLVHSSQDKRRQHIVREWKAEECLWMIKDGPNKPKSSQTKPSVLEGEVDEVFHAFKRLAENCMQTSSLLNHTHQHQHPFPPFHPFLLKVLLWIF